MIMIKYTMVRCDSRSQNTPTYNFWLQQPLLTSEFPTFDPAKFIPELDGTGQTKSKNNDSDGTSIPSESERSYQVDSQLVRFARLGARRPNSNVSGSTVSPASSHCSNNVEKVEIYDEAEAESNLSAWSVSSPKPGFDNENLSSLYSNELEILSPEFQDHVETMDK